MMTLFAALALVVFTIPVVAVVVLASYLGVERKHGSIYEKVAKFWGWGLMTFSGVRTRLHGAEFIDPHAARIYVANHVSWYDVFALASVLPRWSFVAKAELRKIPIFGRGAEAVGTIFVERKSPRAALQMYEQAAAGIRDGANVVVCPEGTRGDDYSLRSFKKGPFVLAISGGVPIVPVVIMGTKEVMPRGQWLVHGGVVHMHFLPPISTTGLTYADRERLIAQVWTSMADCLQSEYGIQSDRRNAIGTEDVTELRTGAPEAGVVAQ